jgi:hypothetical protein
MSLKQQSTRALASLQQEIAKREKELTLLRAAEKQWKGVMGAQPSAARPATATRRRVSKKKRLDWNKVLAGLPVTFNNKLVQQKTGKPMEQVYAGLSRWVKDNKVKRNPDGVYQKLSSPAAPKKAAA